MRPALARKFVFVSVLVLSFLRSVEFPALFASEKSSSQANAALPSAHKKIDYIERNGRLAHPDPKPTQMTEGEINAYLASGALQLPTGVQDLRLQGEPGVVTGNARVDLTKSKPGVAEGILCSACSAAHTMSWWWRMRTGPTIKGSCTSIRFRWYGVEIPNFVLQLFAEKYIAPRYPGIGIDSHFTLPDKIDTATVGLHEVTVTQK